MLRYLIKRIIFIIPLLLGIATITFIVIHLSPGSPTDVLMGVSPKIGAEAKARIYSLYGLDKPIHIQYFNWLKRIIVLDFGNSFKDNRPVLKKILERLPATLLLNITSLLLIFLVAIPIGVISAVKHNSIIDKGLTLFVFIGFSIPTFWLALILIFVFGVKLQILPISGMYSINYESFSFFGKIFDLLKHLILPVTVSAFGSLAYLSRYSRGSMLEVIKQEYIKSAYARGIPHKIVIFSHALRNALIPIITIFGLSIPGLIGGSFIFETIFAWPGMGRLGYQAIMSRDYPVIMGIGIITAFLTLLGNLIADLLYAYYDPRIRYQSKT